MPPYLSKSDRGRRSASTGTRRPSLLPRKAQEFADQVPGQSQLLGLQGVLSDLGVEEVDGFLFDLGISSHQVDLPQRGFSYMHNAPLDMRMDPSVPRTAAELLNTASEMELRHIISRYGEERWADRIAASIVAARQREPFVTTFQLVDVVKEAIPAAARRRGPHPAKRTFQALRIAVNDELGGIEKALRQAVDLLKTGGRIGVISFHSLEDRMSNPFGIWPGLRVPRKPPLDLQQGTQSASHHPDPGS